LKSAGNSARQRDEEPPQGSVVGVGLTTAGVLVALGVAEDVAPAVEDRVGVALPSPLAVGVALGVPGVGLGPSVTVGEGVAPGSGVASRVTVGVAVRPPLGVGVGSTIGVGVGVGGPALDST
jgi:hypothetical protein